MVRDCVSYCPTRQQSTGKYQRPAKCSLGHKYCPVCYRENADAWKKDSVPAHFSQLDSLLEILDWCSCGLHPPTHSTRVSYKPLPMTCWLASARWPECASANKYIDPLQGGTLILAFIPVTPPVDSASHMSSTGDQVQTAFRKKMRRFLAATGLNDIVLPQSLSEPLSASVMATLQRLVEFPPVPVFSGVSSQEFKKWLECNRTAQRLRWRLLDGIFCIVDVKSFPRATLGVSMVSLIGLKLAYTYPVGPIVPGEFPESYFVGTGTPTIQGEEAGMEPDFGVVLASEYRVPELAKRKDLYVIVGEVAVSDSLAKLKADCLEWWAKFQVPYIIGVCYKAAKESLSIHLYECGIEKLPQLFLVNRDDPASLEVRMRFPMKRSLLFKHTAEPLLRTIENFPENPEIAIKLSPKIFATILEKPYSEVLY